MKRLLALWMMIVLFPLCCGCHKEGAPAKKQGKLVVVTTLFPLYDFARNVGGDRADVTLLLPPGVEAHSFEPKPADAVKVAGADVFVYTGDQMEPWVKGFLSGIGAPGVTVVDSSRGIPLMKRAEAGEEHEEEAAHHEHGSYDPHVWLDFANAQVMVDNIAAGMAQKNPTARQYYLANAQAYKEKLAKLDAEYREGLANCGKRVFLQGGHYAFGYLARRYGLKYESAAAVNADAEPTPAKIASLVKKMKALSVRYVYSEELLSPRVAEVLARETGAQVLKLNGAHNVGKDDLARGATFISLMERNLANLRTGLECR